MLIASATSIVQGWVPAFAGLGGTAVLLLGVILGWKEYRHKARAQTDEARVQTAEADTRLAEVFARLILIANGRDGSLLSETAVSELIGRLDGTESDDQFRNKLAPAVLPGRVGIASQVAAIWAITELIARHPVLERPGLKALDELKDVTIDSPRVAAAYDDARSQLETALNESRDVAGSTGGLRWIRKRLRSKAGVTRSLPR